jgi:four helix bundle protein
MTSAKLQSNNNIQIENSKRHDLEDRTFIFAGRTRELVKKLSRSIANSKDGKQLIRSTGSVGANYIEANESLSKKDFLMRIKICRKEAKESRYWFKLLDLKDSEDLISSRNDLVREATELLVIFSAIIRKSE